ncbi:MAG: hypothetical protein LQ341_000084 [Variospora aurantia]|nr:MAG: hypothetical protein LQ341_000084 [Variospora aurantia]
MPSRASKHFFHKNRSQASLFAPHDANGAQPSANSSPIDSSLRSPSFPPPTAASFQEGQQYGHPSSPEEPKSCQPVYPARSQSQRSPRSHSYSAIHHQPTIHLVDPATRQTDNLSPSTVDEDPDAYYYQAPAPRLVQKEEPKKRRFFGLASSSKDTNTTAPPTPTVSQRLGRSISVRTTNYPPQALSTATSRPVQQRWPSQSSGSTYPPTASSEEADEGGAGLPLSGPGPPIPNKHPLRSSDYRPGTPNDNAYRKKSVQGAALDNDGHPRFERQGSATSASWDLPQSIHHQRIQQELQQYQLPPSYQPSPSSATSASSHPLPSPSQQEAPTHCYQELQDSRPPSQHSYGPPSPVHSYPARFDSHQHSFVRPSGSVVSHVSSSMGPPQTQSSRDRGSQELAQQQHNQSAAGSREGTGYQPYHQLNQGQGQPQGPPPAYNLQLGINGQQSNSHRAQQPSPMAQTSGEQGRSTPPPSRSRDDLTNPDVAQLMARHDELQDKYRKVKKYYFDKDAQVQQLQNTLAHQRLAQSRTSLDDNEYINRFSRLDGMINNLAFNIRREWRSVPPWLAPAVNKDATTNPTKEMTAVGRACISRWIVDELFNRFFHPGLEPGLSTQLKIIEKNLRRFAAPTPSDEEKDGLVSKISNWRLSTLEGLNEVLSSTSATENKNALTSMLVEKMVAALTMNLKDPPPPGLEGGVSMIVELAVGIASNLPLESRDVFVEYIYPNARIDEGIMKFETGLPPLTNPGEGIIEDSMSRSSTDKPDFESNNNNNEIDSLKDNNDDIESPSHSQAQSQPQQKPELQQAMKKKGGGMFGGFMGGKKAGAVPGGSGVQAQKDLAAKELQMGGKKEEEKTREERVRFCAFMAVEVRGRSVLVKAPVWTHAV